MLKIDGSKDDNDGAVFSGLAVHSITEVVLQPAIGYAVLFFCDLTEEVP